MTKLTVEQARRVFKNWREIDWGDPDYCPMAIAFGQPLRHPKYQSRDMDSTWAMSSRCNPWIMQDSDISLKIRRQDGSVKSGEEAISWMVAAGLLDPIDAIDAMKE